MSILFQAKKTTTSNHSSHPLLAKDISVYQYRLCCKEKYTLRFSAHTITFSTDTNEDNFFNRERERER